MARGLYPSLISRRRSCWIFQILGFLSTSMRDRDQPEEHEECSTLITRFDGRERVQSRGLSKGRPRGFVSGKACGVSMTRGKLFRVFFCYPFTFTSHVSRVEERRRLACRAYSAEVTSATKAGSSRAGTAAFFNTPKKDSCFPGN
jgi:hypothetical protein